MTFHVGQKVVCIDDNNSKFFLKKGKIYTIDEVDGPFLYLSGVYSQTQYRGFWASRFRPAVERKTSIEIFQKMLLPQQVNA